jgi:hypothetical protein
LDAFSLGRRAEAPGLGLSDSSPEKTWKIGGRQPGDRPAGMEVGHERDELTLPNVVEYSQWGQNMCQDLD